MPRDRHGVGFIEPDPPLDLNDDRLRCSRDRAQNRLFCSLISCYLLFSPAVIGDAQFHFRDLVGLP